MHVACVLRSCIRGALWGPWCDAGGVAKLKEAVADPASFLERLADSSVRMALKLARPQLEPKLKARGLTWEDTAPMFEQLDSHGGFEGFGLCGMLHKGRDLLRAPWKAGRKAWMRPR